MTNRPTTLSQFTSNLWVLHSRRMDYNAGAWISDGQALLIDPGVFADEIELLARMVREQGAEPTAILLTHSHWDHILGPEHLPGVKVLAQEKYGELVARYEPETRKKIEDWEKANEVKRLTPFVIPKLDEAVGAEGRLTVGSLRLRLVNVPGHAADQLAVFEEASGTLWASDILSDVEVPFVSDNLAAYEQTLARLAEWQIRALVPGHGWETQEVANIRARIAEDREYLAQVRAKVAEAVGAGKSVEETVAACAGMEYRLKDEMTVYHRLNVESAYLELGGQADPKKIGWDRDWEKYPES